MKTYTLQTERLTLNLPQANDIPRLIEIMKNPVYSENTSNIPFPYTRENGEFWVNLAVEGLQHGKQYIFAIRLKDNPMIIGGIGLGIDQTNNRAEMGYWLDDQYWDKGIITEAAKALIQFGFDTLKLHKIFATHFTHNSASGRVMQKIGMKQEAILKEHLFKNGNYLDLISYAIINNK
ncbi:GNAT family N-acetyltransferase [Myroides injenensis]|uniref:GNAT family N-acetyltransferase n=1 Tax=Myroides injenensis TaxID=1183151 RepID=UPI00028886A2|nr:GNAT family N-acetyltransferase [Myroides injenensis]